MTNLEIKGDWNIIKARLKLKWAQLTDDDLDYQGTRTEELIDRLQQRTGETREAIETTFRSLTCDSSESMYRRFLSRNWSGA